MNIEEYPNSEDIVRGMHASRLCNPIEWFDHSRALIAAARSAKERADILIDISEKNDLLNVVSMLYGFAIENLFKAIWIYKKYGSPDSIKQSYDHKFPDEIKTHDLNKLAKLVNENIAVEYQLALELLTESTIWAGRYPCSIRGDDGIFFRNPSTIDDAEKIYAYYSKFFTIGS